MRKEIFNSPIYGFGFGFTGEDGQPVKKTKREYPYSYDPFVFWKSHKNEQPTNTVYSDRLFQWDYNKYNYAATKVFGNQRQDLSGSSGNQLQELIRVYYDNHKIQLIKVIEYCNASTGYPVWRLDYIIN